MLLWGLVADTDRWDRAAGLAAGQYRWDEVDGRWVRRAKARQMGFEIEWIEPPYEWIEGRFVRGERVFLSGPVDRGGMTVRLEDAPGEGTLVHASMHVAAGGVLGPIVGPIMRMRFRGALRRYLETVAELLDEIGEATSHPDAEQGPEPAVVGARHVLQQASYHDRTSGPRSPTDTNALEQRLRRLREEGTEDALVRSMGELLSGRPDEEVAQIRPFEWARTWNRDREQVLRAFLHATRVGLVDLRWQVNCPVCRVSAGVVSTLDAVDRRVHCEACRIDYEVDFGDHVEAVFQISPALRTVQTAVYCASSPAFRPHVLAQLRVGPGEQREEAAHLPRGRLLVRDLYGPGRDQAELDGEAEHVRTVATDGQLELSRDAGTGRDGLRTENRSSQRVVLSFERAGWAADAALGSVLASFSDFLDLFAAEAPAAGVDLSISHLALLFSDLTGSTAMYEHSGDARAFALVQQHFRLMEEITRRHHGAVVKTMGDAVMASFSRASDAVRAAVEMIEAHHERRDQLPFGVRLGMHAGPCLAVRANDRLDFFGTTVNVASRLESESAGGQLVLTEALADDPELQPVLQSCGRAPFEANLKGIKETQRLVAVTPRPSPSPAR
jgi:class 3 adenylate cyclase